MSDKLYAVILGGVTFSPDHPSRLPVILNTIDGIRQTDGVAVVITSNFPEKLDDAIGKPVLNAAGEMISSRPGRCDRIAVLCPPDATGRRQIAGRICKGYEDMIERLVTEGYEDTGAQFENRCIVAARTRYWEDGGMMIARPAKPAEEVKLHLAV